MRNYKQPLLSSIGFGLFIAFVFFALFYDYYYPEFISLSLGQKVKYLFETALLFYTIGFLLSITAVFIIGLPLYLLANKLGIVNIITCTLGGGVVTVVPYFLFYLSGWNLPNYFSNTGIIIVSILFFCGGVSGAIFCFLKKSKIKGADASKSRDQTP